MPGPLGRIPTNGRFIQLFTANDGVSVDIKAASPNVTLYNPDGSAAVLGLPENLVVFYEGAIQSWHTLSVNGAVLTLNDTPVVGKRLYVLQLGDVGSVPDPTTINALIAQAFAAREAVLAILSTDQTANLAIDNHIEFDTAYGSSGVTFSSGTGQSLGQFTLPGGRKYLIEHDLSALFSAASANIITRLYQVGVGYVGNARANYTESVTNTLNRGIKNSGIGYVDLTGSSDTQFEIRISSVANITSIYSAYSWLKITEV